jgi:type II secretory pathway pseudopilin PulG
MHRRRSSLMLDQQQLQQQFHQYQQHQQHQHNQHIITTPISPFPPNTTTPFFPPSAANSIYSTTTPTGTPTPNDGTPTPTSQTPLSSPVNFNQHSNPLLGIEMMGGNYPVAAAAAAAAAAGMVNVMGNMMGVGMGVGV